jgi:hypothetical protein
MNETITLILATAHIILPLLIMMILELIPRLMIIMVINNINGNDNKVDGSSCGLPELLA